MWCIPGHARVHGNEEADPLVEKGNRTALRPCLSQNPSHGASGQNKNTLEKLSTTNAKTDSPREL